jgi:Fur family transcriptional regulator, stress-responsive regulator
MLPLLERLQARGCRMTAQRRIIAEVFTGEHIHLTADDVLQSARTVLPEVSRATVYNALNDFTALGELLEVTHADGKKRYDPNVLERHHHLVCVDCDRMLDVRADDPPLAPAEMHGFEILEVAVTFHARCPDCTKLKTGAGR